MGTRQDAAIRRGAKVMALAVLSPYPFIQPLAEAAMARALEECLLLGGGQEQGGSYAGVLRRLWACVNEFDVGTLPRPSEAERALMRRGVAPRSVNALEACGGRHYRPEVSEGGGDRSRRAVPVVDHMHHIPTNPLCQNPTTQTQQAWVHRAQLAWQPAPSTSPTGPVPLPITLPLHASGPDDILPPSSSSSSQPPPILTLLRTFGPDGVARIYRALLHGQRTLFVGHGHAAAAVARLVLAAAALLAPPLQGLLRRVFPYVTLSDLRFLETPGGFVAGTTNPVFARREEWYDLLCVLPPAAANSAAGEAGGAKVREVFLSGGSWVCCVVCSMYLYANPYHHISYE